MATDFNIYIDQGVTFSTEITITLQNGEPMDLTEATIRSQIRKSHTSTVAHPFTIIKSETQTGVARFMLSATETAEMKPGRYVYDAEYDLGGVVVRFLKGIVTVYPRVTR